MTDGEPKARAPRIGGRMKLDPDTGVPEIVRLGRPPGAGIADLYAALVGWPWPALIAIWIVGFVAVNVLFAAAYAAVPGCIGGMREGSFAEHFFFSVQTLATIGYGSMAPATTYGNVVVTIEAMLGLLGLAMATGVTFAKFSRPRANVIFCRDAVVTDFRGKRALVFRVVNARGSELIEASMRVAALIGERTPEGHTMRRLVDLQLERSSSPFFYLSWMLVHTIDEKSPLHGLDAAGLREMDLVLVCTLLAMDSSYGTTVHARHGYTAEHVLFDRKLVDVVRYLDDGRIEMDFDRFHETVPC